MAYTTRKLHIVILIDNDPWTVGLNDVDGKLEV
ncbi:hypothetical protein A1F99_083060 [Pyrenophora tritici-repentis]|nr:hypothetical protein A1F99_083060 [Pyrenophora tritici-repentis]